MEMFKLIPSVADYIWGGRRLIEEYGIKTDKDPAAEAWVLSCHSAGPSTVEDGEFKGQTLEQVWENHKEICGTNGNKFEFFPILIKFIDAKNNLSIQVHPDNDYAMRVEGEYGKTEAWYILDCDEGAELILGFNREVSVEEFKKAAQSEEMLNIVNKVKVKKGDLFFIESGTLHAICKGILLAEVQQNSNTTYRVYDYGRVGADGKPRALHIDKAADVTKLCPPTITNASEREVEKQDGGTRTHLTECDLFKMYSVETDGEYVSEAGDESFVSLLCLDGSAEVVCGKKTLGMKKGESLFIPASSGEFKIIGKTHMLETRI
ncbi:MAG: type I phosphomannose isomerase catalytic subunit [Oscillospiraceae bacterium]|nr:class I mannose-6-phosphate isomerase [Ruminococcus sp.]MDD7338297.1 class I mannose-6-phosphate isomerase [Ruminococcus sp.]MDY6060796.1 type I phosphomannose isomerase catalytic subunit [Oscillospiraceae bacterium]